MTSWKNISAHRSSQQLETSGFPFLCIDCPLLQKNVSLLKINNFFHKIPPLDLTIRSPVPKARLHKNVCLRVVYIRGAFHCHWIFFTVVMIKTPPRSLIEEWNKTFIPKNCQKKAVAFRFHQNLLINCLIKIFNLNELSRSEVLIPSPDRTSPEWNGTCETRPFKTRKIRFPAWPFWLKFRANGSSLKKTQKITYSFMNSPKLPPSC